jgi:hypothetical protein
MMTLRRGEDTLIWRRKLWIALCGGIVWEEALNLSSDRILNEWMNSAHISLPDSPDSQQPQPEQKTIGSDTQFCSPDDGRKGARNMLWSNWLPINHYLLHPVGPAFICLYKMHGHSNIKKRLSQICSLLGFYAACSGKYITTFWKTLKA